MTHAGAAGEPGPLRSGRPGGSAETFPNAKRGHTSGVGQETRKRLIEAPSTHFTAGEYGEISLESIARLAGVTAPSVVRHSASKEQPYAEAMRETVRTFGEQFAKVLLPQGDAVDSLVNLAAFYWDYCRLHPELARLLIRDATGDEGVLLREAETGSSVLISFLREFTVQAQASGKLPRFDPDAFVLVIGGMPLVHFGLPALRKNVFSGIAAAEAERRSKAAYLGLVKDFISRAPHPSPRSPRRPGRR